MSEGLSTEEVEKLKNRLKQEFSGYYEKAGGRDFRYYHLESVYKASKKIAESEGLDIDKRVLEVAALFHDIGRKQDIEDGYMDPFEGHEGHPERSADMVREYVEDVLTDGRIRTVEKVVGNHHSRPETVEGKILQDADRLAKYGVSDLWRMFHYASDEERPLEDTFSYFEEKGRPRLESELEDFHFDTAREAAEERLGRQVEALERIREEAKAEDI
ncbi:MAG: HD domain-containing protein [Candidatus Nanohaloarchaea archaeon]